MEAFETRIRGFHAKAVENIMSRTVGRFKAASRDKSPQKTDNICTYIRKFEVDRENLNLAKRIMLCESEHNYKKYQREWKKTKNFIRVRSNFKRKLFNEHPRIFKFQPIRGRGDLLITLSFPKFQPNPISFHPHSLYEVKILSGKNSLIPTNNHFTLDTICHKSMAFYVSHLRKQVTCKLTQIKENNTYEKGKFEIQINQSGEQITKIVNSQGKIQASIIINISIANKKEGKDTSGVSPINQHTRTSSGL